jgi:hypothetical protein
LKPEIGMTFEGLEEAFISEELNGNESFDYQQ